jgi:chemotaxis response regulator CheB
MGTSLSLKISQQKTGEHPVDIFFRTLAESHGPRAVCVVLSGTGAKWFHGIEKDKGTWWRGICSES